MGIVSSRPDDPAVLYLKDPTRFAIASLVITDSRDNTVLTLSSDAFPATYIAAQRASPDDAPIEFVQDPDVDSKTPSILLKLSNESDLYFHFTFTIRQVHPTQSSPSTVNGVVSSLPGSVDTTLTGLTFAHASNVKELDNLITREFHANPNLQNNSNVQLIGDLSTSGCPSYTFDWSWKWRPPKTVEDRGGGCRNSCSFLEYDQRTNRLNTLATFSFWVQNRSSAGPLTNDLLLPLRHRIPSSRSVQSQATAYPMPSDEATFQGSLYNQPSTSALTVAPSQSIKVDLSNQRPGEDMSAVEDGPLFRATMKALEQKTGNMRARMKKVLKKAEAAHQAQTTCNESVRTFLGALAEASPNGIQPAMEHYFDRIARRILIYEEQNAMHLQRLVIDPLTKLYNHDIKLADAKKKDFEDESKDYYAYVGRYLGQRQDSLKHKKRVDSDSKYQHKRRNFELKRFDYSSFMQDLHGGRKEQEVLSHLTKYAEFQARNYLSTAKSIETMMPQLEALVEEVTKADKEYEFQRTEREEKRRVLEKSSKAYIEPETLAAQGGSSLTGSAGIADADSSRADNIAIQTSVSERKFKGIRDLDNTDHSNGEQRKEGLVWALSRPGSHIDPKGINKQAWHKFWIVLDQGKLSEYSNWKQKLDLHIGPIDLRMASVREARNTERRFCFEVITPAFKRTYQATSEEDMQSWILAISNALQSAVEGRGAASPPPPIDDTTSINKDIGSVLTGKSSGQSASSNPFTGTSSGVGRRITVGGRPSYGRAGNGGYEENPAKLLEMIRNAHPSNHRCADCGSSSKVEWVSINLGMVFCIECSGIHRSLGTHISKVRSLTLDVKSFTIDIVELLLQIGNNVGNSVWEGRLDLSLKPITTSSREERLEFITAKYSHRAYVQPLSPTLSRYATADEVLLASIKKSDIQGVLYAIALGANLNATDRSRGTHVFFLALAAADPAVPSLTVNTTNPNAGSSASLPGDTRSVSFPIAELLVQNGANVPPELPSITLSAAAQAYYTQKSLKAARTTPISPTRLGSSSGTNATRRIHPSNSTAARVENLGSSAHFSSSGEGKEREKAHKRGSAGARFAGKVASLGLDR